MQGMKKDLSQSCEEPDFYSFGPKLSPFIQISSDQNSTPLTTSSDKIHDDSNNDHSIPDQMNNEDSSSISGYDDNYSDSDSEDSIDTFTILKNSTTDPDLQINFF